MRQVFCSTLIELASVDERIVLLTGDLGFAVLEPFAQRFPGRFINIGVAEQNMVGVSTGLAEAGYTPYIYSIATFASMRGYEFIRNGPNLHRLPMRIVGVGGGVDYGLNGPTHHALEDLALMRTQPGITTVAPADPAQTRSALPAVQEIDGPAYLRLGKTNAAVPGLDGRFALGRTVTLGGSGEVAIVAMGSAVVNAAAAAAVLAEKGISAGVVVVSSFNPSPVDDLVAQLRGVSLVLTVEAHYVDGALGSLVAETIAEHGLACRLVRAGIRSAGDGRCGGRDHLELRHGLSPDRLADTIERARAPLAAVR